MPDADREKKRRSRASLLLAFRGDNNNNSNHNHNKSNRNSAITITTTTTTSATSTAATPAVVPSSTGSPNAAPKGRTGAIRGATSRFGIRSWQSISSFRGSLASSRRTSILSHKRFSSSSADDLVSTWNDRPVAITTLTPVAVPCLPPLSSQQQQQQQQQQHQQQQQQDDSSGSTSKDQESNPLPCLNTSIETTAEDSDEGQKMKATLARTARPSRIHIRFSDDPDAGKVRSCVAGSTKPRQQVTENGKEGRPGTTTGNKGLQDGHDNSTARAPIVEFQVVDVQTASMDNVPEAKIDWPSWSPIKTTKDDDHVEQGEARLAPGNVTASNAGIHAELDGIWANVDKKRPTPHGPMATIALNDVQAAQPQHERSDLQTRTAELEATNAALLALKVAHEEQIAAHEHTIAISAEIISIREETIVRHEGVIADLNRELRFKEAERTSLVENFCAEMTNRNNEITILKEDKWTLMARIADLEHIIAKTELKWQVACHLRNHNQQQPAKALSEDEVRGDEAPREEAPPLEDGEQDPDETFIDEESHQESATVGSSSPMMEGRASSSVGGVGSESPFTIPDSVFCATHSRSRLSEGPGMHHDQPLKDCQTMASRVSMLAKERIMLEQDLLATQRKFVTVEMQNSELQARVTVQEALIRKLSTLASVPAPGSKAPASSQPASSSVWSPDLPVLSYSKPYPVWSDRVKTCFMYYGLLNFVQRDVPAPVDKSERQFWKRERIRAAILLKSAVDDHILEDVLYLCGQSDVSIPPSLAPTSQAIFLMENPHRLFNIICTLRRTIPASPTDLNWVDRIHSSDYDGIESFVALVLCIDRRYNAMFGAAADHYDALLPKIQDSIAQRFPDLKKTALALDLSDMFHKKKWQLSTWMAKLLKKRQAMPDML